MSVFLSMDRLLQRYGNSLNDINYSNQLNIPNGFGINIVFHDTPANDIRDLIKQKAIIASQNSRNFSSGVIFIIGGWRSVQYGSTMVLKQDDKYYVIWLGEQSLETGRYNTTTGQTYIGYDNYSDMLKIIANE